MKLYKLISQLSYDDFSTLADQLKEKNAEKLLTLLNLNRTEKVADEIVLKKLKTSQAAYYTLKSRLFDKIQEFHFKNTIDTRIELLKNVANIEHLVYQTPPETAIGILKKLESELISHDLPSELITVYKALKKLHLHSEKHYHYLQLYNKHVAFNLAHDKADEILSRFCITLGEYYLSKNSEELELLVLYKKEMMNVCRLYQSHHLQLYKNTLLIHYALFCPADNELNEEFTIEEKLNESTAIINSHPEDKTYKHFNRINNFLYFEYYQQLKMHMVSSKYFDEIKGDSECLLLLNHSSFVYHFLISKIEHLYQKQRAYKLMEEEDVHFHKPNIGDRTNYTLFHIYKATAAFYAEDYLMAIETLENLINKIVFKNIHFVEIEIKSFLAMLYLLTNQSKKAESSIQNILRKIAKENSAVKYGNAISFLKLLKTSYDVRVIDKAEKMMEDYASFNLHNKGQYAFLPFMKLNENHFLRLGNIPLINNQTN